MQKGFSVIHILVLILITLAIFAGLTYLNTTKTSIEGTEIIPVEPSIFPASQGNTSAYKKTYTGHNFSFQYPGDFKTCEEIIGVTTRVQCSNHIRYSADSEITINANGSRQTAGIELGSVFYNEGDDIENYKGNSTSDNSIISNLVLPTGSTAETYVHQGSEESATVVIKYKESNQEKRIMIWCSYNHVRCTKLLTEIMPTFKLNQ